jgi:hypothetical protein
MGGVSIWHWLIVLVLFVPWIWACGSELPIRALRWALAARIELRWERKLARSASIRDWPGFGRTPSMHTRSNWTGHRRW